MKLRADRSFSTLTLRSHAAVAGAQRADAGMALLAVLLILLVVTGASTSFIWFMNQQQTRVGARLRSAAAMAVAEAGVHRALAILESVAPDGHTPGRTWRPTAYSEPVSTGHLEGRFTLSLIDDVGAAILITSTGEVAGVTRRLRARVHLASPALLAALYGASVVRLERRPAATFILPYGAGTQERPWLHIMAGRGVFLSTTHVSINDRSVSFDGGPGPVDAPEGANRWTALPTPGPVRVLLAPGAELLLGQDRQRVDLQQLRVMGVAIDEVVRSADALPRSPVVDRAFFQAQAGANTSNASLNEVAGQYAADRDLARKRDSLYSPGEFNRLLAYLKSGPYPPRLVGVIYVTGELALPGGHRLEILDGALITEGTVQISEGASLEITHSAATRTLPGLIVLDDGTLSVTRESRLRVHGLVYTSRVFAVGTGAKVDIVGSVLGGDRVLSFRNFGATIVIRYDPAVLGTPGLRVPADSPVVAWVAAWEELP